MALMMPVPLSYYSPLVGGLPGATALGMEPTYYWDALSDEALDWLNRHTGPGQKVRFATYPTSWLYHGGEIEHLAGDGVMGVFGAQRAHGDDALRAVRAAVEMFDELDKLNQEVESRVGERLQMRIGVNTGTVVVGGSVAGHVDQPRRPDERRRSAPRGTGTARRVLIGDETRGLVGREVRTEPAGELDLRGRREPTVAHRLVGSRAARARPNSPSAPWSAAGASLACSRSPSSGRPRVARASSFPSSARRGSASRAWSPSWSSATASEPPCSPAAASPTARGSHTRR